MNRANKVAAASEPGCVVTNGMGQYSRNERNANANARQLVGDSIAAKMPRGDDLQRSNVHGLYPASEGASYAGGILSAGVDGIKVAEALALDLLTQRA